ncbi:MAG TPA: PH domain-containing protein, partial [Baekduia sp.]|nr:PH domain-containing protein [Baekduia sp.]
MTTEAPPSVSGPRRLHFAAAIGEALGAIRDVAFPLLIGVVVGGSRSSASAILLGLAGAVIAAVIGIVRWQATTYRVTDRALHFRSGVFSPDETVVPLARIQAVDTVTGPVQRLFGVTGLHVQTPGGGEEGDVVLSALSSAAAAELRGALGHPDRGEAHIHARLSSTGLLATALTAPQLGVVLPVLGGVFGALQNGMIGEGETFVRGIDTVHEAAVVAAALLGAAFVLSFLGAVVAFSGFEVRRVDDRLRIRRGLLQRRAISVPVGRIDGVQIVSSPLRRPFGLVTLRLEATSLGGRETAARTLFPLMRARNVEPFLARFAPELAGTLALAERPPRRALRRYLTLPVTATALLAAAIVLAAPSAWPLAPVLLVIGAYAGLDAYTLAGLSVDGPRVLLRTWRRGSSVPLVARRRRLQAHALSRNPLQRRAGLT